MRTERVRLSRGWSRLTAAGVSSASDTTTGFDGASRTSASAGWLLWAIVGVALLPFVISAVVLLVEVGSSVHAFDDNALNELHTRDVGHHLVVLGPYSRDAWNHLGPAMYYLLAVPYRLTGSNSVGMYVGALLINAVAVAGMLVIAYRRGGLPVCLLVGLGLAMVVRSLGESFLRDPWNPYVTVLPFGLFLFTVWELVAGRCWALPGAAGIATFLVQTHVGYVPLAVPLLIGGTAWLIAVNRRQGRGETAGDGQPRGLTRAVAATGAVLLIMWIPPVIGIIRGSPGNLATAVHYFLSGNAAHGLIDGYRVLAEQFSARPEWLVGPQAANPFSGQPDFVVHAPVPWLIIPLGLAGWWLSRRGITEAWRLGAVVAAALLLGVLAVARTIGPIYAYRLRWTWLLGMLGGVLVLWTGWALVMRVSGSATFVRSGCVLVAVLMVVVSATNGASATRTSVPDGEESSILGQLFPRVLRALPSRPGVVITTAA
ncbi:MAG: hypothetical protein JOZ99_07560, partial [Actinobacteria bacterium]|nr:hypothetical protein [Actinomycetota bacterium]